jgi:hypothetical protein
MIHWFSFRPFSIKNLFAVCLVLILLTSCTPSIKSIDERDWIELSYLVDGKVEIHLKVPHARSDQNFDQLQFVKTEVDEPTRLFWGSYDPGRGRDRDLLLTDVSGVILKSEQGSYENGGMSIEDVKNDIYLTHPRADRRFDVKGEVVYSGRSWLKINLKGKPHGVTWSTPIFENFALKIAMTMYGDEARESKLFAYREEVLRRILATVEIYTIDNPKTQ